MVADTASERAIRWLIAMMVLCCDPLALALTARRRHGTDHKLSASPAFARARGEVMCAIGHGRQKESQMAMQFRVMVEIEGSSTDTFKIGFEFSDEEGSGIEFYSNHDLPEDVTEKLGALAIDFINNIGNLVLTKLH